MKILVSLPLAMKGVAVGLVCETLSIGLILAFVVAWVSLPHSLLLASCLIALYALSVMMQFIHFLREGPASSRALLNDKHQVPETQAFLPKDDSSSSETLLLDKSCEAITRKYKLTERESEILRFAALGRSAKYIADELFISHNTAKTHIKHVYEKLNIHSKQELIDLVLLSSPR